MKKNILARNLTQKDDQIEALKVEVTKLWETSIDEFVNEINQVRVMEAKNKADIAANKIKIESNGHNITANTNQRIATNQVDIATNKGAIDNLKVSIERLSGKKLRQSKAEITM